MNVTLTVFDGDRVVSERIELPARLPGEIDVAITSAAICGSDLHTVLGRRRAPERTVLGHEGVGLVVDADPGAVDLRGDPLVPGDRVVFALFAACGACDRCRSGLEMKCRQLIKYGHESVTTPPHATGTLASHTRLLAGMSVLRVPPEADESLVVSAGCAAATAAEIVAACGPILPGTRVLVLGAGAVGAYCAAMLAGQAAETVVRDPSAERLNTIERLGALREPAGKPAPYPIVIEASGSPEAFVDGLEALDLGGRMITAGAVSPGSAEVKVDPSMLTTRRLTVTGIHNYRVASLERGVDWLLAHADLPGLRLLHSPPRALEAVQDAFAEMRTGRYPRVVVRP